MRNYKISRNEGEWYNAEVTDSYGNEYQNWFETADQANEWIYYVWEKEDWFNSANSQDLKKYKKLYPNDDVIRLQQEIVLHIKLDNGTFSIKKDVFEEDLYLNNSANYNSKRSLSYATFFNLDTIEASSFSLQDDTYTENKVTNFNEKNNSIRINR